MPLAANILLYDSYAAAAKRAVRQGSTEACQLIEKVAFYAWKRHPGRFADGAVENLLLGLGQNLPPSDRAAIPKIDPARDLTLHVASELHSTGGHSRVLVKWIQEDRNSQQALVLTRQPAPIPDFLNERIQRSGVQPVLLDPAAPHAVRAASLRALSRNATRIVLHQHPDDAIPVLAYAVDKPAPVIMFNHAHFWFSFGTTIADLVVNIWPYYGMLSKTRRAARRVEYLDTTGIQGLDPLNGEPVDKLAAKVALGLPPSSPVAMSIGHESYFTPNNGQDLFRVVIRLLQRWPDLHFLFVGVRPECPHIPAELLQNERVQFLGVKPNPLPYYQAADLCLESLPVPSLGAIGEASSCGEAYPVQSYGESETIMRPTLPSWPQRARNEAEYFAQIEDMLSNPEQRRAAAQLLRGHAQNLDASFQERINHIYRVAASLKLGVQKIPAMPALKSIDDEIVADNYALEFPLVECAKGIPGILPQIQYLSRAVASRHITFRQFRRAIRAL